MEKESVWLTQLDTKSQCSPARHKHANHSCIMKRKRIACNPVHAEPKTVSVYIGLGNQQCETINSEIWFKLEKKNSNAIVTSGQVLICGLFGKLVCNDFKSPVVIISKLFQQKKKYSHGVDLYCCLFSQYSLSNGFTTLSQIQFCKRFLH